MDIVCPSCAATYEIDDASVLETGRKVRCADCGTIWRAFRDRPSEIISAPAPAILPDPPPMAPAPDDIAASSDLPAPTVIADDSAPEGSVPAAEPASDARPEPEPAPRAAKLVRPKAAKGPGFGRKLKALVSPPVVVGLLTVAIGVGAVMARERVVRLVPQSGAVFAAIGLPVNLRGIEIRNVKSRMVEDNGVSVLVIDGDLVGVSRERVTIPRLRFSVIGLQGQELYVWSAQADRPSLQPGETLNFRRRLAAPPADGRDVSVRFLSASDITAGLK
jgi:predicted Zn finger-like uncharacterized protein